MAPQDRTTFRSPEETALLRTVPRRSPSGVLGRYHAPDALQFAIPDGNHDEEDIQRTVQAFAAAFEAVAEQRP